MEKNSIVKRRTRRFEREKIFKICAFIFFYATIKEPTTTKKFEVLNIYFGLEHLYIYMKIWARMNEVKPQQMKK